MWRSDAGALVIVDVVSSLGRGAVRLRRLGHRRGDRRVPEGALRQPRHRLRGDQRPRLGGGRDRDEPAVLLRLGDLPAFAELPDPENPWTPGDQRDAGPAGRARASTSKTASTWRSRATGCCRARSRRARRRSAWTCSARAWSRTGPSPRSALPRRPTPTRSRTRSARTSACVLAPGPGPLKGKVFRIGHFGYFSRARHPPRPCGARDDPRDARVSREARRRGRGRRGRVRWSRRGLTLRARPGHGEALRAGSGSAPPDFQVDVRPDLADRRPRGGDRALRRADRPQRNPGDGRGAGGGRAPEGRGARRDRPGQRRRRGRHAPRRHGRERARSPTYLGAPSTRWPCCSLRRATCRRLTRRCSAGKWERAEWEGVELAGKTLGARRPRPRRGARGHQGIGVRDAGDRLRPLRVSAERAKEMGVDVMPSLEALLVQADFVSIHLPRTSETEELIGAHELCADETGRAADQHGARRDRGRGRPGEGARGRSSGRRRARRVRGRAHHRQPAVRGSTTWW